METESHGINKKAGGKYATTCLDFKRTVAKIYITDWNFLSENIVI